MGSAVAAICHPLEASTTAKLQFSSLLFRIFLSLMEAAGLTDVLRQEGGFTLFAPSDKAFAGLSERDMAVLKSTFARHFCLFDLLGSKSLVRNAKYNNSLCVFALFQRT